MSKNRERAVLLEGATEGKMRTRVNLFGFLSKAMTCSMTSRIKNNFSLHRFPRAAIFYYVVRLGRGMLGPPLAAT